MGETVSGGMIDFTIVIKTVQTNIFSPLDIHVL